jgi:hypothetical protein
MKRIAFAALAALSGLLISAPAHATALPPGSTVTPGTFATNPVTDTGNVVLATTNGTATGTLNGATLNVSYTAWVVQVNNAADLRTTDLGQQSAGNLDFVYQFTNLPSSSTVVESTSHFNFGNSVSNGVGVDYYAPGATNVPPNLASRGTVDGATVKFNFLGSGDVNPGQTSTVDVIETRATNFTIGNYTFQDGVTINTNAYQPAVIPEPTTMVLAGLGTLGFAGYGLRRRKARTA